MYNIEWGIPLTPKIHKNGVADRFYRLGVDASFFIETPPEERKRRMNSLTKARARWQRRTGGIYKLRWTIEDDKTGFRIFRVK